MPPNFKNNGININRTTACVRKDEDLRFSPSRKCTIPLHLTLFLHYNDWDIKTMLRRLPSKTYNFTNTLLKPEKQRHTGHLLSLYYHHPPKTETVDFWQYYVTFPNGFELGIPIPGYGYEKWVIWILNSKSFLTICYLFF